MFKPLKPVSAEDIKYGLIENSQTLKKGEVIIPGVSAAGAGDTGVVLTGGGTTAGLLGVVLSIVGDRGKILEVDEHAAAADNVTNAMVRVAYMPMYRDTEFEALLDADAETTDNSGTYGNFAADATGLLLDESTYVAFGTVTAKQFFSYGLVDGNSARKVTCRYIGGAII